MPPDMVWILLAWGYQNYDMDITFLRPTEKIFKSAQKKNINRSSESMNLRVYVMIVVGSRKKQGTVFYIL